MDRWIGRSEQAGRQALELEGVGGGVAAAVVYVHICN